MDKKPHVPRDVQEPSPPLLVEVPEAVPAPPHPSTQTLDESVGKVGGCFDLTQPGEIAGQSSVLLTYYERLVRMGFCPGQAMVKSVQLAPEVVTSQDGRAETILVAGGKNPYVTVSGLFRVREGVVERVVLDKYEKGGKVVGEASYPLHRVHEIRWGVIEAEFFPKPG